MQSVHSYMNALLFFEVFFLKGGLELRTERSWNLCERSFNSAKNGPVRMYIRVWFTMKYYNQSIGHAHGPYSRSAWTLLYLCISLG